MTGASLARRMRSPPSLRSLAIVTSLVAVTACRTASVVPPDIDAVAIVEGDSAAGAPSDTVDGEFTVRLDRARWTARTRAEPVRDFWDHIAVLDPAAAERAATSLDERTFVVALRTLMAGDPEAATVAFTSLYARATDPSVHTRARVGLTMALAWRSDWQALASLARDLDSTGLDLDDRVAQAGVERWARAFAAVPTPRVFVPDAPETLPMRRSVFGTPMISVRINGRPYQFWLDTGASMTLLSSTVAAEAGVMLAAPDTLALAVVAGHIPARAVVMDSLSIGRMVARGLTAAVVSPGALRLSRTRSTGIVEAVQIDGVIGTDLLRQLDLVLDASAGTITIRRPRRDVRRPRNLFWVGYPVVKLVSRDGRPVLFGLDTGAEGTFVTPSLLRKIPRIPIAARRMTLGGLGTETVRTKWVVRELALSDGDYALTLSNAPIADDSRWTFVTFDGVIGSDIALASRMHLDFVNGVFDVRPTAGRSAAAPPSLTGRVSALRAARLRGLSVPGRGIS